MITNTTITGGTDYGVGFVTYKAMNRQFLQITGEETFFNALTVATIFLFCYVLTRMKVK